METSYIGQKGYTISKQSLSSKELESLKLELTLSPIEKFGITKKDSISIPVYRENKDKIYIPRFYGVKKYGIPVQSKLLDGVPINVPFVNTLRDYQENIVSIYFNHIHSNNQGGGGILEVPCGRGKTIMALNIISKLKQKTIILVHKEFLMNQWIDRIKDFLPSARVGIIQGSVFDIHDKDIVIAMIQTLYNKEYKTDAFASFGLTIIDEVHRIGSEEFSKTLTKIITKYMLGISATVDRKDGLTDILYMYIGDKIYNEERKDNFDVQVRAIQYKDETSEQYNKVEYDFKGNIKYSTMVSRISDYTPRCVFLVRIIQDLVMENPTNQIMVLSHKRDLLKFLHDEIQHKKIASCGYYIGGMKQEYLQSTENQQIVLATYAMAAEALDIKSLNTLVMVTPKTDIIQSVGRILRTRCDGKIIVDVIDSHDVFQNQWKKRRAFYNKSNYIIHTINNELYNGMVIDSKWKLLNNKKNKKTVCDSDEEEIKRCMIPIEDL
jgi:superfamily II DNA or RNA helicase